MSSQATQSTQSTNLYQYAPVLGYSGKLANKAVSLIKTEGTDKFYVKPFYFVAGLVTLATSGIFAILEAPSKALYNTGVFLTNKISALFPKKEVKKDPSDETTNETLPTPTLKEKAKNFVNNHKVATGVGAAAVTGTAAYLGGPAVVSYVANLGAVSAVTSAVSSLASAIGRRFFH